MALILGDIAEAFKRIEEQIFVPGEDFVSSYFAHLEADDLVLGVAELATRAKRDLRLNSLRSLKGLQDLELRSRRIDHAQALRADDAQRMSKSTNLDRAAAVGAGERSGFDGHCQPSKSRRFFKCRSSNSTARPRKRSGGFSL